MSQPIAYPFYIRLAFILIILLILGYFAIILERILTPLMFSFLFSILLLPFANFLEKRLRFPRIAAAIVAVALFVTGLLLVLYMFGSQIADLARNWPLLKSQLTVVFYDLQLWIMKTFHVEAQKEVAYINNTINSLVSSGTSIVGKTVLSLSSVILFFVFIFLYTFFLLFYRRLLARFITVAFTEKYVPLIAEITTEIRQVIRGFIVGLFLEMVIVSTVAILIFLILGIQYFILLGLIVGVFNIIPYVGIFSALIVSTAVTFATTDPRHALYVAAGIIAIHLVDSNFLMPKIVGSHVKINPLIVVLGVVGGEMLWGIPGMFLAIPYLAIAKVIFDRVEGMQPWGILLGEEEQTPDEIKPLQRWMKKAPKSKEKKGSSSRESEVGK
ncbi:MAG TPA: AI-2E family transporter [Flavisolibacter sp.]|nr:AI-2E family transporter [Flavisolibacter sp.]